MNENNNEKYFRNIFQFKTIKRRFYSQLEDFQPCFYSSSRLIFWPFSSGRNTGVTTLYRLQLSFLQSLLRTDPAPSLINSENFLYFYFSKLISILRSAVSSTKIYYQKMLKPAFCVWMHVLLIRVHRNWKLAKSLIGNDLAPT